MAFFLDGRNYVIAYNARYLINFTLSTIFPLGRQIHSRFEALRNSPLTFIISSAQTVLAPFGFPQPCYGFV